MARKLFLATLLLSATPWAIAQERDPRLRVTVRLAQGAPSDTASAVPDVEEALRRARPDGLVRPPSGEAPADVELWLVFRRMWARGSRLPSDPARSTADSSGMLRARPDWHDPGFEFEALTKERRKELGIKEGAAIVTAVRPGPAQEAGLAAGDVVLRADGQRLGDAADLASALYRAVPGTRVDLALVRGPERLTATLTVR